MLKTAVRRVGNGLGITLPKNVIENLHLTEGDELYLNEEYGYMARKIGE